MVIRQIFVSLFVMFCMIPIADGITYQTLQSNHVTIQYPILFKSMAINVSTAFSSILSDVLNSFNWEYPEKPTIILTPNSDEFMKYADNPFIVAFAMPHYQLIMIDSSKLIKQPYEFETTLRHELCHLILHYHIQHTHIPRWFDEGIAQWMSKGIGELISNAGQSRIYQASISNQFIPFDKLSYDFPKHQKELILAYEQSQSFLEYIIGLCGQEQFYEMLNQIRIKQIPIKIAIENMIGYSFHRIEQDWRCSFSPISSWVLLIIQNLYEILFVITACLCVLGFFKLRQRKKMIWDDDDDLMSDVHII